MPAPYKNVPFPTTVARGSTGGPRFNTSIADTMAGAESRNINWSRARYVYNISTGIRTPADMADVIDHFHGVFGRAYSFPFQDFTGFEATDEVTGQLTATTFQLQKTYARITPAYVRKITKPMTSPVPVIKVSGTPVTPASIDYLTGIVTFASPPAAIPTWSGQFYVPVRFDTDDLPVSKTFNEEVQSITLISDKDQ